MPQTHRIVTAALILALLGPLLMVPAAAHAEILPGLPAVPVTAANTTAPKMGVGIYVNSIDNLDLVRGTYSMDFYLHFQWTDPRISDPHFEIMNGEPTAFPYSQDKLPEVDAGPVKNQWYRVKGDFIITPNNRDYPFESGITPIEIEDTDYNSTEMEYVPLADESGVDPKFTIPGWKIGVPAFAVTGASYPWNETYSHLAFSIPVAKNPVDSVLQTMIPLLIFCIIAGLSFFIKVEHNELVHLRYVLVTSMFISAVMYHFSQLSLLPGLGVLKLFDKLMIGVYLFLAITLVVTTVCYLAQHQWEKPALVGPINRAGAVLSILLPVITLGLLAVFV